MTNEEETKTKNATEKPVEIKPDPEIRQSFSAEDPKRRLNKEDI